MLTHLRQGNGEASNSTPTVAYGLSLDIPVCSDPVQNLLNSLIMTSSDIHLDRVDFITFRVNFVPAVESFSVEIFPDLRFVVHTRLKGCNMLSVLHRRNERRSSCDNKGQKGNQCLHSANDVVQHLVQNDNVRRTIVAIRKKDESNLGDRRRTRKIQVERKDATYRQRTNATSTSIEFRIRLFSNFQKNIWSGWVWTPSVRYETPINSIAMKPLGDCMEQEGAPRSTTSQCSSRCDQGICLYLTFER